jgi:hypothetical protein
MVINDAEFCSDLKNVNFHREKRLYKIGIPKKTAFFVKMWKKLQKSQDYLYNFL